jgi:hypothetical protein
MMGLGQNCGKCDVFITITRSIPLADRLISPRGHHPPSIRCLGTDMGYLIYLLLKLRVSKGKKICFARQKK